MVSLELSSEQRNDINKSIFMRISYIETGNPNMRRNDAIDSRDFGCIKKTSLDEDRIIVSLSDFDARLNRTSPGRSIDVDEALLLELKSSVKYRMAHIETGTPMRRLELERFNNALGSANILKARPVHGLTTIQSHAVSRLESLYNSLDDLSFGVSSNASIDNRTTKKNSSDGRAHYAGSLRKP